MSFTVAEMKSLSSTMEELPYCESPTGLLWIPNRKPLDQSINRCQWRMKLTNENKWVKPPK